MSLFFRKKKCNEVVVDAELFHASANVPTPPDTKTMRESTEHIESFIFCRHSPLNSQNSAREVFSKLGGFRKFGYHGYKLVIFSLCTEWPWSLTLWSSPCIVMTHKGHDYARVWKKCIFEHEGVSKSHFWAAQSFSGMILRQDWYCTFFSESYSSQS